MQIPVYDFYTIDIFNKKQFVFSSPVSQILPLSFLYMSGVCTIMSEYIHSP